MESLPPSRRTHYLPLLGECTRSASFFMWLPFNQTIPPRRQRIIWLGQSVLLRNTQQIMRLCDHLDAKLQQFRSESVRLYLDPENDLANKAGDTARAAARCCNKDCTHSPAAAACMQACMSCELVYLGGRSLLLVSSVPTKTTSPSQPSGSQPCVSHTARHRTPKGRR